MRDADHAAHVCAACRHRDRFGHASCGIGDLDRIAEIDGRAGEQAALRDALQDHRAVIGAIEILLRDADDAAVPPRTGQAHAARVGAGGDDNGIERNGRVARKRFDQNGVCLAIAVSCPPAISCEPKAPVRGSLHTLR